MVQNSERRRDKVESTSFMYRKLVPVQYKWGTLNLAPPSLSGTSWSRWLYVRPSEFKKFRDFHRCLVVISRYSQLKPERLCKITHPFNRLCLRNLFLLVIKVLKKGRSPFSPPLSHPLCLVTIVIKRGPTTSHVLYHVTLKNNKRNRD